MRDPLGGINSLWPLFGIANQLLAAIALVRGHHDPAEDARREIHVDHLCAAGVAVIVTLHRRLAEDLFSAPGDRIPGAGGQLELPCRAGTDGERRRPSQTLIFNARLDAAICGLFLVLVTTILVDSVRIWLGILRGPG